MGVLVRRICVELKRPFFEVMRWPVSELQMWSAHFQLEHEEYERAKEGLTKPKVVELSKKDDSLELQVNSVMAVF